MRILIAMRAGGGALLALSCLASSASNAEPQCAQTIVQLRQLLGDPQFPLRWRESSMDDGKPLEMTIAERDGELLMSFFKIEEGLWAEGLGVICSRGRKLEARFPKDKLVFGKAAHWAMRYALAHGADFTLMRTGATSLRIGTTGWSGLFSVPP